MNDKLDRIIEEGMDVDMVLCIKGYIIIEYPTKNSEGTKRIDTKGDVDYFFEMRY